MGRVLADDDIDLSDMLKQYLETEGFKVSLAHDGALALQLASENSYDLMVLDVMMPKLNGFDVLRELRKHSLLPILMLTARTEDIDSIVGLELGADDYLPKPCNPRVLVARIQAILRRSQANQAQAGAGPANTPINIDDLEMHRGSRIIKQHGQPVAMTSTEYGVIEILLLHAGETVNKDAIYLHALGRKQTHYDRSVDMHISHIRKKLGPLPNGDERIKTVRGMGYQYVTT